MKNIKNKIAVVTGAGSGIGRATAIALAKQGMKVICLGRTGNTLGETVEQIEIKGYAAYYSICDVGKPTDVNASFATIREKFGNVDVLINNAAAFGETNLIEDQSVNSWMSVLQTNLLGTALCTQAVLPAMKRFKSGYIINVSSATTTFPYTKRAPYGASKAAIEYLTYVTAAEVAQYGVIVNAIAPGHITGDRLEKVIEARATSTSSESSTKERIAATRKAFLSPYKLKHGDETVLLDPEDIAEEIIHLLTSNIGYKTTGKVFYFDCGFRL